VFDTFLDLDQVPWLIATIVVSRARGALEHLPAIRSARDRLLAALRGDRALDGSLQTLESDPGLALRALRVPNADAPRGTVGSLAAAVTSLGAARLAALAASIDVADPLLALTGAPPLELFRLHALATRSAMEHLLAHTECDDREEVLTAALLHDIGKLVLVQLDPNYLSRGPQAAGVPGSQLDAEQGEFGIDHAAAGGELAREWGFPERLCRAIEGHHCHGRDEPGGPVRLADMLAHYGQGDPVDLEAVVRLSDSLGLSRDALGDVLYELPPIARSSRAPIESCPLSLREVEVLRLLAEGKLYKQIAAELGLSPSTVRSHLHRVYTRIGVVDRTQAVLLATRRGWI
jgi:putative nucleotidyltransferase with HDIG domain